MLVVGHGRSNVIYTVMNQDRHNEKEWRPEEPVDSEEHIDTKGGNPRVIVYGLVKQRRGWANQGRSVENIQ